MTTEVTKCEQILADLQAKKQDLLDLEFNAAALRKELAYEALAVGTEGAKKKLAAINKNSVQHATELESIDAALIEAEERLQRAKYEEELARDREMALQLKEVCAEFSDLILADDDLLAKFVRNRHREEELWLKMQALGWHQNIQQLRANTSRILLTAMFQTPNGQNEFPIAPHERRSGTDYIVQGWAGNDSLNSIMRRHLAGRTGEEQIEERAA